MCEYKYEKLFLVMWQLLLGLIVFVNSTSAVCNVCQKNQAACINSTSFYLCFGDNQPNTERLYHCKSGFDCTDLSAICVQTSSQRQPSCGDTTLCGMCSAHRNYLFACLSRTTFQMCYGATRPTGQIGYCPSGYVCHGNSDAICVLKNSVDNFTCDVVDDGNSGGSTTASTPTTPTSSTKPTTTTENPPTGIMTPTQVCEKMRTDGLFPTVPNDPYCKRYIYCFYTNGVIQGREYSCSSGTYYLIQQAQCVFNKPTYCL